MVKRFLIQRKLHQTRSRNLFEKVLPDYDRDAVYVSDMKKVFIWYNFLLEKEVLEFTEEEEAAEETESKDRRQE